MNPHHAAPISPYLVFFRPARETRAVGRDSSLLLPLVLAGALRTINMWLDTRVASEQAIWVDWVLTPIEPILLAAVYHGIARFMLRRAGELAHLIRLFCYASIGMDLFLLPVILIALAFPPWLWLREILGGLVFLYWLCVAGYFSKVNYSLTMREVVITTCAFVALVILAAFGAGYIGYRLSIPVGHPILRAPTLT